MITLATYADFEEFIDLMYELIQEGLSDEAAFVAACQEMPALLDIPHETRYAPARVVLFDDAGQPSRDGAW